MEQSDLLIFEQITQPPGRQRLQWSDDENARFLDALHKFGRSDARAISLHVGTRTPAQIHSHAQKHYARVDAVFVTANHAAQHVYGGSARYLQYLVAVRRPYAELSRVRFPASLSGQIDIGVLRAGCALISCKTGVSLVFGTEIGNAAPSDSSIPHSVRLTSVALLPEGLIYCNVYGQACCNAIRLKDAANAFLLGCCAEHEQQAQRITAFQSVLLIVHAWKSFAVVYQSDVHKIKDMAVYTGCPEEFISAIVIAAMAIGVKEW